MLTSRNFDKYFKAETDLTTYEHCFVTRGTNPGQVKICTTTDRPLGVLMNAPNVGETALVRLMGFAAVKAQAAYSYNAMLMVADAYGALAACTAMNGGTSTTWCVGYAPEAAGAAGNLADVEIHIHRICTA